ncbi:ubiquinone/menaquinone biosynthesis methyltransferase [bacterium]|nr:ubiquinone/menaquinone biosynthesis methyltransferase [bacterium]
MENLVSAEKIRNLFNEISSKYDFMNNVISFGLHNLIKKSAIKKLKIKNGAKALDLCTGTGDIARHLAERNEIKSVCAVDFSINMLELAKKRNPNKKTEYIYADCTKLPFQDNSFDVVTIFFGLRNIEDKTAAIQEIYRVLKTDGVFLHLDFQNGNKFCDMVFNILAPILGKLFTKSPDAYKYLVRTKKAFYRPDELKQIMHKHNFKQICRYNFLFSTICAQVFEKNKEI